MTLLIHFWKDASSKNHLKKLIKYLQPGFISNIPHLMLKQTNVFLVGFCFRQLRNRFKHYMIKMNGHKSKMMDAVHLSTSRINRNVLCGITQPSKRGFKQWSPIQTLCDMWQWLMHSWNKLRINTRNTENITTDMLNTRTHINQSNLLLNVYLNYLMYVCEISELDCIFWNMSELKCTHTQTHTHMLVFMVYGDFP